MRNRSDVCVWYRVITTRKYSELIEWYNFGTGFIPSKLQQWVIHYSVYVYDAGGEQSEYYAETLLSTGTTEDNQARAWLGGSPFRIHSMLFHLIYEILCCSRKTIKMLSLKSTGSEWRILFFPRMWRKCLKRNLASYHSWTTILPNSGQCEQQLAEQDQETWLRFCYLL